MTNVVHVKIEIEYKIGFPADGYSQDRKLKYRDMFSNILLRSILSYRYIPDGKPDQIYLNYQLYLTAILDQML